MDLANLTVIRVGFRIASTCVWASRGLVWAVSGPQGGSGVAPNGLQVVMHLFLACHGCYRVVMRLIWAGQWLPQ
jgi:hypothetical protein